MPGRYDLAMLMFAAIVFVCAIGLLALVCWDRQPIREPRQPTVPMNQRLPPA